MTKTNISDAEEASLKQFIKTTPLALVRFKSQAVLMAVSGASPAVIAAGFDRKPRTVSQWLKAWQKERLASIFSGHEHNNNAGKLTNEQRAEIRKTLQSPPSDFGLPKDFWDVPGLKSYISAAFGIVYESDQSYHFLLKFSNLSFKYPATFDLKRDEDLINERMAAIKAEIKPLFHDDRWEVFTVDEVRMEQEALTRRAWLKKGKKTVIKVNRDKQAQSYIGFLNQKDWQCELFELSWQNQKEVLAALEKFLAQHPDRFICLIWDNAPFHKGKEIRAALAKRKTLERVHLIALPPYAPDHNPIEKVWNSAKHHVANIQHETFAQTKQAFQSYVESRAFHYAI